MQKKSLFIGLLLVSLILFSSGAFAVPDIIPPVTTFTSFQPTNTSDQNITLTCTDNNTGCKTINYKIDNTNWIPVNLFNYDYNLFDASTRSVYGASGTQYHLVGTTQINENGKVKFINSITDYLYFDYIGNQTNSYYTIFFMDGTNENTSLNSTNSATPVFKTYSVTTQNKDVNYIEQWMNVSIHAGYHGYSENRSFILDINNYGYNPYNFLYSNPGNHTIQYYSTDNADNNETDKNASFTTYGTGHFTFKDENTGTNLDGVTVSDGTTTTTLIGNTFDTNFQGIPNQEKTYSFTKTGYGTRYYQLDSNQYSDFNITFALLPTSLGEDIQFRFFKPDQSTVYSNIYVQVKDTTTNFVLGRLKTDPSGQITFNLDANATGLEFDMNNGENTYNATVLTINKPKNEQTLTDINANWSYVMTGLASWTDLNVSTATKVFAIYSNTVQSYSVLIGSTSPSPTYSPRKYDIQVFGNTSTYTLTPYLIDSTNSVTTTLYTINAYTNQAIGDITIKIYRNLPTLGKTVIEQTVTDAKGQSIVYLLLNQTYSFEINVGASLIRTETYTISGTSSTIYFKIDPGYDLNTTVNKIAVFPFFTPGRSTLYATDQNITANITYGQSNNATVASTTIACYNDSNLLFQDNFSSPTMNFIQTYDLNLTTKKLNNISFDRNYSITCVEYVTLSDGNTLTASQSWIVSNNLPQQNLGMSLRPFFGCSATADPNIPCPMMIVAALFITMFGVAGIMIETGFTYPEFGGLLFLMGLGFFAFFLWIPPILYALILVISLLVYVALGVRRI